MMERNIIIIRWQSVFVGRGYIQHVGTTGNGMLLIIYHMYRIPQGHELMDAVSFSRS